MNCSNCDEKKRINEDRVICDILKREISPFWGLIDGTVKCPKTNKSRYDEQMEKDKMRKYDIKDAEINRLKNIIYRMSCILSSFDFDADHPAMDILIEANDICVEIQDKT